MSWQPSLLKLQMIIFCLPIIKADVQAYMVGSHLTHMLEEWLLWGHTVTSYGYGYLILEQKTVKVAFVSSCFHSMSLTQVT